MYRAPLDSDLQQVTVEDLAELFGVHRRTIIRWQDGGKLPFRKIGGRRFSSRADVVALLAEATR